MARVASLSRSAVPEGWGGVEPLPGRWSWGPVKVVIRSSYHGFYLLMKMGIAWLLATLYGIYRASLKTVFR